MLTRSDKSELTIKIETTSNGQIIATSIDLPDLHAQASSKEEALANLEMQIRSRLVTTEIMSLKLDLPPKQNPWLDIAGKYANEKAYLHYDRFRTEKLECRSSSQAALCLV